MNPRYARTGRTVVATAMLCLAAVLPAAAQENRMAPPPEDYQDFFGLGTKQLKIWGGIDVEETFTTNVLLASDDEDTDTITSIVPSLHARFDHSDDFIQVDYVGRDRFYSDHDEFNGMEHDFNGLAHVRAGKLTIELYDYFQSRKDPFNVLQVTERIDITQNDAGASLAFNLERIDIEGGYMMRMFRVHDGPLAVFDHDRTEFNFLVAYDVEAKSQALLEYGQTSTEYDQDMILNNWTSMRVVGGFRNTPTTKTRAVVKAGWVSVDSDDDALIPSDDASGLYLSAAVDWDVEANGTLKFTGLRQPVESIFTGVTMSTRFTADFSHKFTPKISANAGLSYETTSEVSGDIDDRTLTLLHAGARFTPTKHFTLRASIGYRVKQSDTEAFEFSDFHGTIGAGVDF